MGCVLIAFVLPKAANKTCSSHIVYQFDLGGVLLKIQEMVYSGIGFPASLQLFLAYIMK